MAIGHTLLTSGEDNGDNFSSTASASISPTGDNLIIAVMMGADWNGSGTVAPTATGNGLTWVQVATQIVNSNWSRLTVLRAMGASPSSGAVTFSWSQGQDNSLWSIHEFSGIDTGGTNGSAAVVQSATNGTSSTTQTVTLAAFGDASNATFGAFGHDIDNTTAFSATPGSGFSELVEQTTIEADFTNGQQAQWLNGNDTSVDITWTKTGDLGGIALEIKIAPVAGATGKSNPMYGPLGGPLAGVIS